jgi:hypothetical protein
VDSPKYSGFNIINTLFYHFSYEDLRLYSYRMFIGPCNIFAIFGTLEYFINLIVF